MKRFAVIDLGTNTFHCLILEKDEKGTISTLFHQKPFVKLASEGIEKIGAAPFQRGLEVMKQYALAFVQYQVTHYKAIGTAALRTATNGQDFIQTVENETGIKVEIIDGNQEATYIYQGVKAAYPFKKRVLIMDIGGGSCEFIIADAQKVLWQQSFPIGVAVLKKRFHHSEPITEIELADLEAYLDLILTPLWLALKEFPSSHLVGASGTFDVMENLLPTQKVDERHAHLNVKDFYPFYYNLLLSNLEERKAMDGIPHDRVEMIVCALILIHTIIEKAPINQLSISAYAMKEGILEEILSAL